MARCSIAGSRGKAGRPFTGYKFRSMRLDADLLKTRLESLNENGRDPVFKLHERSPRHQRQESEMRRYSLDELPQLYSVLIGK